MGSRRALLLHGSTSSSSTWSGVAPALAALGWTVEALDLPSHGDSAAAGAPLTPQHVAPVVDTSTAGSTYDLVVGHSFGAAVALELALHRPEVVARVMLEELPGPTSVDWPAEAAAVLAGAAAARHDLDRELVRLQEAQPRWSADDCRHAVVDLARCRAGDIADGLHQGPRWITDDPAVPAGVEVGMMLAPDKPGVNQLDDATALRAGDRERLSACLRASVTVLRTGHCPHRDDPGAWLATVAAFSDRHRAEP